jgi:hypothetical protein
VASSAGRGAISRHSGSRLLRYSQVRARVPLRHSARSPSGFGAVVRIGLYRGLVLRSRDQDLGPLRRRCDTQQGSGASAVVVDGWLSGGSTVDASCAGASIGLIREAPRRDSHRSVVLAMVRGFRIAARACILPAWNWRSARTPSGWATRPAANPSVNAPFRQSALLAESYYRPGLQRHPSESDSCHLCQPDGLLPIIPDFNPAPAAGVITMTRTE